MCPCSTIAGYSSGYLFKTLSKMAALAIGFGFVTVQGLRYIGVIGEVKYAAPFRDGAAVCPRLSCFAPMAVAQVGQG